MKLIRLLAFAFIAVAAILLIACNKTGPAGPQGPAGPTGATGATGATGTTGPQGLAGTANVIYSRWTTSSTWAIDGTTGLNYFDITATSLTQSILSNGSIHVYWAVLGDTVNNVRELPFAEAVAGNVYFHNPKYSVGKIRIETSNLSMATTNKYRFILIPGGILGGRYAYIDFHDYNAAVSSLGIPY